MTDAERITKLEDEVLELRAKVDFLLRQAGFREEELADFQHHTTIPAPPPTDGV